MNVHSVQGLVCAAQHAACPHSDLDPRPVNFQISLPLTPHKARWPLHVCSLSRAFCVSVSRQHIQLHTRPNNVRRLNSKPISFYNVLLALLFCNL